MGGKIITPGFENKPTEESPMKPPPLPDGVNVIQIVVDNNNNQHKIQVMSIKPMTVIEELGTLELAKNFLTASLKQA